MNFPWSWLDRNLQTLSSSVSSPLLSSFSSSSTFSSSSSHSYHQNVLVVTCHALINGSLGGNRENKSQLRTTIMNMVRMRMVKKTLMMMTWMMMRIAMIIIRKGVVMKMLVMMKMMRTRRMVLHDKQIVYQLLHWGQSVPAKLVVDQQSRWWSCRFMIQNSLWILL